MRISCLGGALEVLISHGTEFADLAHLIKVLKDTFR